MKLLLLLMLVLVNKIPVVAQVELPIKLHVGVSSIMSKRYMDESFTTLFSEDGSFFQKEDYNPKGYIIKIEYHLRDNDKITVIEVQYNYNEYDMISNMKTFINSDLDSTVYFNYLDSLVILEEYDYLNMKSVNFEYYLDDNKKIVKAVIQHLNPITQRAYKTIIQTYNKDLGENILEISAFIDDTEESKLIQIYGEAGFVETEIFYRDGYLKGSATYYFYNFHEGYWLNEIVEYYLMGDNSGFIVEKEFWAYTIDFVSN